MTWPSASILLYGKDARTDAIAEGLRRSATPCRLTIYSTLRIPGLVEKADRYLTGSLADLDEMVRAAREVEPDLVIVGPEDPLGAGLVDALDALGCPSFGPAQSLARIETSKSWARSLVERHGIDANPRNRTFHSSEGLAGYLEALGDVVVKPDGLTGGKGVKVQGEQLASISEALAYAESLVSSEGSVVVEERLDGEEFSLQTVTDGTSVVHCPIVQDHKRAYAGDTGPNTGGMGSYSCPDGSLPFLSSQDVARARQINESVIEALASETGRPYRGVLYGGFMAVADGVRLIEYNARFGDPEAMNVLPLLSSDLLELCRAVATGKLGDLVPVFEAEATVCKYVVPAAYPEGRNEGDVVVSDDAVLGDNLRRYWAATELHDDGTVRLTGSRGLAFVGIAGTMAEAEALAESGASSVTGAVRHRSDIGTASLVARRVEHMRTIRSAGTPG
ncbi:MAG: phosphoribosylamine--glycine ligase [Acidimicrobiales bacterium]